MLMARRKTKGGNPIMITNKGANYVGSKRRDRKRKTKVFCQQCKRKNYIPMIARFMCAYCSFMSEPIKKISPSKGKIINIMNIYACNNCFRMYGFLPDKCSWCDKKTFTEFKNSEGVKK